MKLAITALLALVLINNQAFADVVPMICQGVMHVYTPNVIDAEVRSGAASVDIPNRQIVTLLGTFPIFRIEKNAIVFGIPSIAGRLDRLTGKMEMFARLEGDKIDMRFDSPTRLMSLTELKCSVTKRLF